MSLSADKQRVLYQKLGEKSRKKGRKLARREELNSLQPFYWEEESNAYLYDSAASSAGLLTLSCRFPRIFYHQVVSR